MSVADGESGQSAGKLAALRTKVELWVAVALMALGFFGGVLVSGMDSKPGPAAPAGQQQLPQEGFQIAPPLSEDDLSGELPPGHPTVNEGEASPAPSDSPAP